MREDRFWSFAPTPVAVFLLISAYVLVYSFTSILTYRNFGMSAFDIGIHDQAMWKIAHGRGLFSTVRGLNIWGDHVWLIMILFAPVYWITDRVESILVLQTIALASGVIPLAALVYRRTHSPIIVLSLSVAWLANPALQNMNLENFHPEVLAVPFILWAIERADARSWSWYYLPLVLAILCKEDVAITTGMIGLWIFLTKSRKHGALTMLLSGIWLLVCLKVILPYFNHEGFFRIEGGYWFSNFWNNRFNADFYAGILGGERAISYAIRLSAPLLGIFLLSPALAMAALPSFLINVLSGNDYLASIDYHYNNQITPILFAATGIALSRIRSTGALGYFFSLILSVGVVSGSLYANKEWAHPSLWKVQSQIASQMDYLESSGTETQFRDITSRLPEDILIPLSVSHNLLLRVARRDEVYMFPNPFKAAYWGIRGENLPDPERVQYLLLDENTLDDDGRAILRRLTAGGEFILQARSGNMVLLERSRSARYMRALDPYDVSIPVGVLAVFAYVSSAEITSIPDISPGEHPIRIESSLVRIPETNGRVRTAEGIDLGAEDNVHIVFAGRWMAKGQKDLYIKVRADDGCRLFIDGRLVLDYDGVHSFSSDSQVVRIRLSEGIHRIVVDYFEWGGQAGLDVLWSEKADAQYSTLRAGQLLP